MSTEDTFFRRFAVIYAKLVAGLVLFLVTIAATHVALHWERIFPDPRNIVVYGTDGCGFTTAMREELTVAGHSYEYGDLDLFFPEFELAAHLNLAEQRTVRLPVVVVGGKVLERPGVAQVIELAAQRK